MSEEKTAVPLLDRYRALSAQAREARAGLLQKPAVAAIAVYDLRLSLRICRILRRFVRKERACKEVTLLLDRCYRATSRVRDRQVGVELVRQLEQGWPRNRCRPSTALNARLRLDYHLLAQEVDEQGLARALQGLERAFALLTVQVSEAKLRRRALRQAEKFEAEMLRRCRRALRRQRETDWHALRLAVKHYRFWVSTLDDWLPERFRDQPRLLKPLQVALGNFHDWVVLGGWLPEIAGAPLERWRPEIEYRKREALDQARAVLAPLLMRANPVRMP